MITLHEVRTIHRPLEEVFGFVAEFSTVAEWDPGVEASSRITDGELGIGTRFAVTAVFNGRRVPLEYEMTDYVANEVAVLEVAAPRFDAVDTIRFRAIDESTTEVDYTAEFTLKGMLRIAQPFLKKTFDDLGRKALDGLVERLG
jgi:carbon monoxide dehydrogenase subunit G